MVYRTDAGRSVHTETAASRNGRQNGRKDWRPPNYRRYAARRRRGRRLRMLGAAAVIALLAGAVFWLTGQKGEETLPAGPGELQEETGFVVAVDPGHGGGDSGAVGVSFDECEMTWRTAGYLMELLEGDERFSPFLTTDGEEYSEPSERAANARAAGAQLLISIHGNSGDDPSYAGFECYPVPPGRERHDESLAFAELIASGFGEAGASLRGQDGVRYIYYDADGQKQIAEISDDSVHMEQSFTLLEESGCPAVLAEQCFVTSPADVAAFGDEEGCHTAAEIYYNAICQWYEANAAGGDVDGNAGSDAPV